MKYLPTTFPHTCTPWLNPPSHYKLKSYFYFLLPSLSLCLNYVFLAEKNFNLSYSPKILAYIFFSKVTGAPGNPVPHYFFTAEAEAEAEAENTETRGNIQNIQNIPFSHKRYMLLGKISYQKTFHNRNQNQRISYITLPPFKLYYYPPFSFPFSAFFGDGNTLQRP